MTEIHWIKEPMLEKVTCFRRWKEFTSKFQRTFNNQQLNFITQLNKYEFLIGKQIFLIFSCVLTGHNSCHNNISYLILMLNIQYLTIFSEQKHWDII